MYLCLTESFEIELFICIKIDLALNNLKGFICHKTQPSNHPTNWLNLSTNFIGGPFNKETVPSLFKKNRDHNPKFLLLSFRKESENRETDLMHVNNGERSTRNRFLEKVEVKDGKISVAFSLLMTPKWDHNWRIVPISKILLLMTFLFSILYQCIFACYKYRKIWIHAFRT